MIPHVLYHGTSLEYAGMIEQKGLQAQAHKHVYLTSNIHAAYAYAKKYDQQVICIVDSKQMYEDGFDFHQYDDEWLVKEVPSKYILQILIEDVNDILAVEHYLQEAFS